MEIKTKYPVVYLKSENMLLPLAELAEKAAAEVSCALNESGEEKVNMVAWSRWGLTARMLACEMPDKIASVTTVCTPHRGLRTPKKLMGKPAVKCWAKLAGGKNTAFKAAAAELDPEAMREFNAKYPNAEGVFYQSCACAMSGGDDSGLSPANSIISIFDGENDGAVSVYSALWGQYGVVHRGFSHLRVSGEIYDGLIKSLAEHGL